MRKIFGVLEGVDYAGKTKVSKGIKINNGLETKVYDGIPERYKEDKVEYNKKGVPPIVRFNFYMEINFELSNEIKTEARGNIILVRYVLSTIANHNKMIEESEGKNPHLANRVDKSRILTPDITFVICSSLADLKKRIEKRPPEHRHEANPTFLMGVQEELKRLSSDRNNSSLYGNAVIIENRNGKLEDTIEAVNNHITRYIEKNKIN